MTRNGVALMHGKVCMRSSEMRVKASSMLKCVFITGTIAQS